ncbi:MAG: hypothetical protein KDH15_10515 [Rhodocyclaceae bacterium]|nr:hypothetical protein [Rhodocyclaceae bacterium]
MTEASELFAVAARPLPDATDLWCVSDDRRESLVASGWRAEQREVHAHRRGKRTPVHHPPAVIERQRRKLPT